jgi:hypothetical protein
MARPHIDFIQAQVLTWEEGRYPAFPGVKAKTLSADPDTGAATVILRLPPGRRTADVGFFACDIEVFVLDGAFTVNGSTFGLDCYGYWPAGFCQEDVASTAGADVLAFIDGAPHRVGGRPPAGRFDQSRAVPYLDSHEMAWSTEGLDPDYEWFGFRWKVLRHHERTDATTFLLDTPAQRHPPGWMARDEVHFCTEEIMILSGELCTPYGVLHAGAYLNRPRDIRHGPYYTRFGNMMIGRVDGKLTNNFNAKAERVTLTPPHNPRLPANLQKYAAAYRFERY